MPVSEHYLKSAGVRALSMTPAGSGCLMVLAHGAGAGMDHTGMEAIADALYEEGVGTFRFNFPYMEQGRKSPGSPRQAMDTLVEAVEYSRANFPDTLILAGGKSYGGRMSSTAASEGLFEGVSGLIFFGFPLHPPGRPSDKRAEHLFKVRQPMLFLQGSRDKLAELDLLTPVVEAIGAEMLVIEGADHSFALLKSNPLRKEDVWRMLAGKVNEWVEILDRPGSNA